MRKRIVSLVVSSKCQNPRSNRHFNGLSDAGISAANIYKFSVLREFNGIDGNVGALVAQSQLCSLGRALRGIRRFFVGEVHADGESSVDNENDRSCHFQNEFGVFDVHTKTVFQVFKIIFNLLCALIFAVIGFVHVRGMAPAKGGFRGIGYLFLGLAFWSIGVFFAALLIKQIS